MTLSMRRNRHIALAASSTALLFIVGAFRRVKRQGRGRNAASARDQGVSPSRVRCPTDEHHQPCPVLWQQVQQRDWLFELPPQIADAIISRLDVPDLKALRATCRQTYLQVAARTSKLVLALDVSPRTWRLASHRLDSIYPGLRELHLILAGDRDRDREGHGAAAAARTALALSSPSSSSIVAAAAGAVGSSDVRLRNAGSGTGLTSGPNATSAAAAVPTSSGRGDGRLQPRSAASRRRAPWRLGGSGPGSGGGGGGGSGGSSTTSGVQAWQWQSTVASGPGAGGSAVEAPGTGSAAAALAVGSARRPTGQPPPSPPQPSAPECLREFVSWSACGHLHQLTLLDLSRCGALPIHRDTWSALVEALGPEDVTLRVPWRCLLHCTTGGIAGGGSSSGSRVAGGLKVASSAGGGGGAATAAAVAAVASGAFTSPFSLSGETGSGSGASSQQQLLPLAPPPRCTCCVCGPAPPDAAPVVSALQVLAKLRPNCSVELEGRGLPVRCPATLQQLCAVSQLASVSLAVCGVRPLSHHAGRLSGLRRLHTLELRFQEEAGGDAALQQILRALHAPVPLRTLLLHRYAPVHQPAAAAAGPAGLLPPHQHPVQQPSQLLLDESALAALAALPDLGSLDAAGLRIHGPTPVMLSGLTRLALRSDRLELAQPLAALFPALEHLELGHGATNLPPTHVLAAAAAAPPPPGRAATLAAAPAGPGAEMVVGWPEEMPGAGLGGAAAQGVAPLVLPDGFVVQEPAAMQGVAAGGGPVAGLGLDPQPQHPHPQHQLLPPEMTLHLRLLQGLSGLRVLSIGGKPGPGVEALSSLTALSSLILVRCSEFRPLRKALEELRGLTQLRSLELHACLGGDSCGYEIARLLRRLQKLANLDRIVVHGCDPRLPQQLATAPLGRLSELQLLGLPELQPLDVRYVVQAQTALRRLTVRGCARLGRRVVEALPALMQRPQLAVEWAP